MTRIRFYYTKPNINEGKKYLKSTDEYSYSHLEDVMKDYRSNMKDNSNSPHPAKCPGMNTIKKTGWTLFNREEIKGENALVEGEQAHGFVKETFPNYSISDDHVIYKLRSYWNVNIPWGYYLISTPTLYHTNEWFSLPGILDSANIVSGFEQLNSFIIMHRDQVIPVGSPISQWVLVKKENYDVVMESMNEDDHQLIIDRDILAELRITDHKKYKLIKQSGLFKSWEDNHG